MMRALLGFLLFALGPAGALAADVQKTSCVTCHGNPDLFDEKARAVVTGMATDVHAEVGLSCPDCHGGNPDPALSEDADAAMDRGYAPNPYRGAPARGAIPKACGTCHSDPSYMKRFRPDLRVDQEAEYWTSYHGRAVARGDTKAATCVDCHGVHGILHPSDGRSPVHPTHVAETCRSCHGDPVRMAGYRRDDGSPLPVDQYARWRQSVHAAALLDKGDLSAPTCNDCHGNHGAAPPGIESVAFVCGNCHGREAELFRASPKHTGFQNHAELLADGAHCRDCHTPAEPAASADAPQSLTECATCHGNHAIIRPTIALLGFLPATPCAFCHESPQEPAGTGSEKARAHYESVKGELLAQAAAANLVDRGRFDWLVDRALELPFHTHPGSPEEGGRLRLRPQFARLFEKFRIGKSSYAFQDPATGRERVVNVVSCADCHAEHPETAENPVGLSTARVYRERMHELTSLTARAERTFLRAKRGGVEVPGAPAALDEAVDSQIELEVLVHTFSAAENGPFLKKQAEGMKSAETALAAGEAALGELSHRRRGLVVALGFVALTLVGLGVKIRRS